MKQVLSTLQQETKQHCWFPPRSLRMFKLVDWTMLQTAGCTLDGAVTL